MRKRGLCCRPMSVRLSVRFVYCIQTAKDIVRRLSQPDSPVILVSCGCLVLPNSNENPLCWGVKYAGRWENFVIFDWNRRLSRKRYGTDPIPDCQTCCLITPVSHWIPGFPLALSISTVISHEPGALPFFSFRTAEWTSDSDGNSSTV